MRALVSVGFWLLLSLSSLVLFPMALLIWATTVLIDPRRRLLHRFTCGWASLYSWLNPLWRVRIEGRERIRRDGVYVMVANHQSVVDIFVLFRLFRHFKWVSKIENFRVPLIGWNMSLNGYISLRRGDGASIREMMESCERVLRRGDSVMIFPEGTRSPDASLRRFSSGAFRLAQRLRLPVLPIVVQGTAAALPKHGLLLGRSRIRVRVLDPMTAGDEPAKHFASRVHDRIEKALAEEQA